MFRILSIGLRGHWARRNATTGVAALLAFLLLSCGSAGGGTNGAEVCADVDCGSGGTCALGADGPACVCAAGFAAPSPGAACVPIADPCAETDCGGHAQCVLAAAGAACLCDPGYTSTADGCVIAAVGPDLCAGIDCAGHGVCAVASGQAVCICQGGYATSGTTCVPAATDPTACVDVDCAGHGLCVVAGDGSPLCVCEPGFVREGAACVANVDPCADSTCGGHGACVVTAAGPACLCDAGFEADGAACVPTTVANACADVDCAGHGSCVATADGPACLCDAGFHAQGSACVADADPCLGVDCGGAGQCVVTAGGLARCLCEGGTMAVGLQCVAAPETAIPETIESDVSQAEPHPETGLLYVPRELLVYALEGHDAAALSGRIQALGGTVAAYKPAARRYIVQFAAGTAYATVAAARDALLADPAVAAVTEQYVLGAARVPEPADDWGSGWNESDPAGANWYLEAIRAPSAWDVTTGGPFKVGVIDKDFTVHADLTDVLVERKIPRTPPGDVDEHGTMVSGLLAAEGANGEGLTGVLWGAALYYCPYNGTLSGIGDCVEWLTDPGRGVRVINFSGAMQYRATPGTPDGAWDTPSGLPPDMDPLIQRQIVPWIEAYTRELATETLLARPWVLVEAAGNEAVEDVRYPTPVAATDNAALRERVLIVGATGSDLDELACYSNRGGLDIVAPGGDTRYTCDWDWLTGEQMVVLSGADDTTQAHGTSLAAPLVAGGVALAWSVYPDWTPAEAAAAVLDGAAPGPDGLPLLDLAGAVAEAVAACTAHHGGLAFEAPTVQVCTSGCVPDCAGKECLADDGCGGFCAAPTMSFCEGDVLHYCEPAGPGSLDCAEFGARCLPDPLNAGVPRCRAAETGDEPPSGRIVSPAEWTTFSGDFDISVEAGDDVALRRITLHIAAPNGARVYEQSLDVGASTYAWAAPAVDTTGWSDGIYTIALWVADAHTAVEADVIGILFSQDCVPDCAAHQCGDDGCGGTCPPGCPAGQWCSLGGFCVEPGSMVYVPAGTFPMGSPVGEGGYSDEQPQHDVYLDAFHIDRFEVTGGEFAAFLTAFGTVDESGNALFSATGANVSCTDGACSPRNTCQSRPGGLQNLSCADHPAAGISWYGARAYCEWAGKWLPTEAQWERAAKGTTHRRFPWGDEPADGQRANCDDSGCADAYGTTAPVGSFPDGASPTGCYDMAGNVSEWVLDWYGNYYYSQSPAANPQGPGSGSNRVLRGGGFNYSAIYLRAASRDNGPPSNRNGNLGFRCAR